jgi:hypothetical protein
MPIEIFAGTFEEVKQKYNEFEKAKNEITEVRALDKGRTMPITFTTKNVYATQSHVLDKDYAVLIVYYTNHEW